MLGKRGCGLLKGYYLGQGVVGGLTVRILLLRVEGT